MATPNTSTSFPSHPENNPLFKRLEDYPWATDPEFQSGLSAILGPEPSPSQAEHLTLRARCFYYSRKHSIPIDFNAYQSWRSQQRSPAPSLTNGTAARPVSPAHSEIHEDAAPVPALAHHEFERTSNGNEPPAPYPTSFSQIVELITSGQPIPGIKDVPDTILEGQASDPTSGRRKKPWEKDDLGGGQEVLVASNIS